MTPSGRTATHSQLVIRGLLTEEHRTVGSGMANGGSPAINRSSALNSDSLTSDDESGRGVFAVTIDL